MFPFPDLFCNENSFISVLFPYPFSVAIKISSLSSLLLVIILITLLSFSIVIPLTPEALLPTQVTSDSLKRIALPALENNIICFSPLVIDTSIKLSPSLRFIAINPDDLGLEKSESLVFLITPLLVAINTKRFSSYLLTFCIAVIFSYWARGKILTMAFPFAERPD